jgi:PTH2 family peptidyl-tRNA hydrolase
MSAFRYKQVLIFRSNLRLSKGKTAAQAGHAAVSAAEEARKRHRDWFNGWSNEGQCKIAVKVKNEEELSELEAKAEQMGLPYARVTDRGLTEVQPGTVTCLGIGPAPVEKVDKITGNLPLL